jgi:hypothetical protein
MKNRISGCFIVNAILITMIFGFVSLFYGCAGMPTIQWKSDTQRQVVKLAVSIGAKAVGLKLAASGFVWTSEIQTFYNLITTEDQLTLDAAQLAEKYIRDNVDPLIAPDVLELAKMIGVEFNSAGSVIGTSNVNVELLKVAAEGFRLAITTRQTSEVKSYLYDDVIINAPWVINDTLLLSN